MVTGFTMQLGVKKIPPVGEQRGEENPAGQEVVR